MKGIYITEECKKELETKIDEPERQLYLKEMYESTWHRFSGKKSMLKEILSLATILPVEDSWGKVPMGTNECELTLPNGVIIETKQ
jgi:hypothetical protein